LKMPKKLIRSIALYILASYFCSSTAYAQSVGLECRVVDRKHAANNSMRLLLNYTTNRAKEYTQAGEEWDIDYKLTKSYDVITLFAHKKDALFDDTFSWWINRVNLEAFRTARTKVGLASRSNYKCFVIPISKVIGGDKRKI